MSILYTKLVGKMSTFGGRDDKGMVKDTGLSFYEHAEADKMPEFFFARDPQNPNEKTWQRLRTDAPYIALLTDKSFVTDPEKRKAAQRAIFKLKNTRSGRWLLAMLVDRGPAEDTGRVVDVSPGLAFSLGLQTDDTVEVTEI